MSHGFGEERQRQIQLFAQPDQFTDQDLRDWLERDAMRPQGALSGTAVGERIKASGLEECLDPHPIVAVPEDAIALADVATGLNHIS